ncbi:MAG: DUF4214 domain-containing protein [Acidimicrobiales bacterium]|nr:DUF4214 domain-containing protein [Acidimicrobiales bacterium]
MLVAPPVAQADGTTSVAATCAGIPLIGSLDSSVDITANDSVDPVAVGGTVDLTTQVPVPVGDVPITATITEGKIVTPIPADVAIDDVTFTASSFSGASWAISGSNVVATLTGSVSIGGSNPPPTMPDVTVRATVGGAPRTISWKVPTSIVVKGNAGIFGNFTATCTPSDLSTVLVTTTVVAANAVPEATDQTVAVAHGTPTPIVLAGTDGDGDPLAYAVATPPAHGTLSGTAPSLTYAPAPGYAGPDAFTFTVSDGKATDTGTVSIEVAEAPDTAPGAPTIDGVDILGQGAATVRWSAPGDDGGQPITGYEVHVVQGATETDLGPVGPTAGELTTTDLVDGVAATFRVAATNDVGTGAFADAAPVTTRWWLPWTSGTKAVDELFTWMAARPPTSAERTSWLAQLGAGTKTTADLIAFLREQADATTNVDPTVRLYSAYLTRIPDAGGLNFWLGRRRAGWTLSRISSNFAASSEFIRRYGSMTNRKFVENIYANVLERSGDAAGITYWTGQLDARKKSRGQVMINFSESSEYKRKQAGNVSAAVVYLHVLGRAPTIAQRTAFIEAVGADGFTATVRALLRTPTFADRAG